MVVLLALFRSLYPNPPGPGARDKCESETNTKYNQKRCLRVRCSQPLDVCEGMMVFTVMVV